MKWSLKTQAANTLTQMPSFECRANWRCVCISDWLDLHYHPIGDSLVILTTVHSSGFFFGNKETLIIQQKRMKISAGLLSNKLMRISSILNNCGHKRVLFFLFRTETDGFCSILLGVHMVTRIWTSISRFKRADCSLKPWLDQQRTLELLKNAQKRGSNRCCT